jgi:osmotically-inducible protein OsmY
MRLLTVLAVAALAAGIYHYRGRVGFTRSQRPTRSRFDRLLERSVRQAIAGAASTQVEVRCARGVVTLRGTASAAERDRVLAAALAVLGVSQVTNFMEIDGSAERLGDEPVGDLGPMQSGIATGR